MKTRAGFRKIIVDGKPYLWNLPVYRRVIVVYDRDARKHEIPIPVDFLQWQDSGWTFVRGRSGGWSIGAVAAIIDGYFAGVVAKFAPGSYLRSERAK